MPPEKAVSSSLKCARCSYVWTPRGDDNPKRCPKCRSIKWNNPELKVTCLRCNHTWNSHKGVPKRCPSCGTHQWNVPPQEFTCKRCGYVWHSKGSRIPCRCPMCTTRTWAQDVDELGHRKSKKQAGPADGAYDELILKEYRRGLSCVDISIARNIPYSTVYDVVRRNSRAATDIKV